MRLGRYDVPVTNPDKPFFPERGLTKGDLVSYYAGVAEHALPHLRRRPSIDAWVAAAERGGP